MSYILDALRRAESERANEKVPGLYDQAAAPLLPAERSRAQTPWLWLLAGATVVLAAAVAWLALRPSHSAPATPIAQLPAPAQATAPAPVPGPAPATPPAPGHAPTEQPLYRPAGAPAVISTAPTASPAQLAARPASPAPAPSAAPAVAVAPARAGEERVPALAELPDEVRRALPALHFDGAVYSDKPANRILMVNGQLLHEGEAITPELSIERINPKGAVLSFRGHRFELTR
ncbi:general secretion pathway protein GspB [Niveibacterium terrae]|uniref:general secretion pathway protein GspB n=1 Tax=Niveibacterium terrae TaxID=3373598 RepID=UPI003A90C0BD